MTPETMLTFKKSQAAGDGADNSGEMPQVSSSGSSGARGMETGKPLPPSLPFALPLYLASAFSAPAVS